MGAMIATAESLDPLALLKRHWGYDGFLPSQAEAVGSVMAGRDTLVILPTGGGKSMCYQLPALALPGTALVVSPLLALMKDQVDALVAAGVAAAAFNSAMGAEERRSVVRRYREGALKLLYVSPEGLASEGLQELLGESRISFIAVDEAHCVSQWGHEYRADYRGLGRLRDRFPNAPMHAYTATATPIVRDDIVESLRMREPTRVVGSFERGNLTYRTIYRRELMTQLLEVVGRHRNEAGIVYAISRKEVERLAAALQAKGVRALPYHAGMDAETRRIHQERFSSEDVDVIVATVAFGMGIDRSNVRYVVHAGMPKSLENYQQEAGRAGRDRLEAECVLIYSAQDLLSWRRIMGEPATEYDHRAHEKLNEVYRFARALGCRHRFLVEYFGEPYGKPNCGACDVCLDEHEVLPDSVVMAQKILSGVARLQERYGAHHVVEMLRGSKAEKILANGHDRLSTYGLLSAYAAPEVLDWIEQLVALGFLERRGEYQALGLTPEGRRAMKGEVPLKLSLPRKSEKSARQEAPREGLAPEDEPLFEALRAWRKEAASAAGVPPYVIFGDVTLRAIAHQRPGTPAALRRCKGVGEQKLERYGSAVLAVVAPFGPKDLSSDEPAASFFDAPRRGASPAAAPSRGQKDAAFALFAEGLSVAEVAGALGRAASTVESYLEAYVAETGVDGPEPWLTREAFETILATATRLGAERLRPIHEALGERFTYAEIRLALAIAANR